MDAEAIDHPNLRVPDEDAVGRARAFYTGTLGFDLERVERYREGEKPFFSVRLTPESVIHLWPTDGFDPPEGTNFDHLCLRLAEDLTTIRETLDGAGVEVERELDGPLGATGTGPSVYVTDPFGYRLELKAGGEG